VFFYPKSEKENIYKNFPIAPIKLGSQLLRAGFNIEIIDSRIEENYKEHLEESLKEALFLGVSVMTGYPIYHALRASDIAKKANKDIPIIWGGWHPSLLPKQTIQHKDIDVVVIGQGEKTIVELAEVIQVNGSLKDIKGIIYKDKDEKIIENERRPFNDINLFQPVDFSLVKTDLYAHPTYLGHRAIFWNTSQGCPFSCGFCCTQGLYNRRWSGLTADKVMGQIDMLVNKMGIDGISFTEDNFMVDPRRVEKICKSIIEKKVKFKWAMDLRVDQALKLTDDYLDLLRKSGCVKVFLGSESGDQEVLDNIDKGITIEGTYEVAKRFHAHDIIAEIFVMVGFPWNPRKDLEKTLKMISKIKAAYPNHQATPFLFTPFPKTKLFKIAVEKGLKVPQKLEEWIGWNVLRVITPWVDRKYLDTVNRLVKFYIPLAYPSKALKEMFRHRIFGFMYRFLHKLALFRIRRNFFKFPVEWIFVKFLYYNLKVKYNLFKGAKTPR